MFNIFGLQCYAVPALRAGHPQDSWVRFLMIYYDADFLADRIWSLIWIVMNDPPLFLLSLPRFFLNFAVNDQPRINFGKQIILSTDLMDSWLNSLTSVLVFQHWGLAYWSWNHTFNADVMKIQKIYWCQTFKRSAHRGGGTLKQDCLSLT